MVAQWYDLRLETHETRVRNQGKQRSRDHPIDAPAAPDPPEANLRCGANRRRDSAVLIELP